MAFNYTPLDIKKLHYSSETNSKSLNLILSLIGLLTIVVLLLLIYMLYKKTSGL
jgi:small-conductance mechanosensitive channel